MGTPCRIWPGEGCRLAKPYSYSRSKPNLPQQYPPTPCWLRFPKEHLRSKLPLEVREEDGAIIKQRAAKQASPSDPRSVLKNPMELSHPSAQLTSHLQEQIHVSVLPVAPGDW